MLILVILLLILSVMLFGAAPVLGIIGKALGVMAAAISFALIVSAFALAPWQWIVVIGAFIALPIAAILVVGWLVEPYERDVIRHQNDLARYIGDQDIDRHTWRYRMCERLFGPAAASTLKRA